MEFLLRDVYDEDWMSQKMGRGVKSVKPRDQSKFGGLSAEMQYLDVEFADGEKLPILKQGSLTDLSFVTFAELMLFLIPITVIILEQTWLFILPFIKLSLFLLTLFSKLLLLI